MPQYHIKLSIKHKMQSHCGIRYWCISASSRANLNRRLTHIFWRKCSRYTLIKAYNYLTFVVNEIVSSYSVNPSGFALITCKNINFIIFINWKQWFYHAIDFYEIIVFFYYLDPPPSHPQVKHCPQYLWLGINENRKK